MPEHRPGDCMVWGTWERGPNPGPSGQAPDAAPAPAACAAAPASAWTPALVADTAHLDVCQARKGCWACFGAQAPLVYACSAVVKSRCPSTLQHVRSCVFTSCAMATVQEFLHDKMQRCQWLDGRYAAGGVWAAARAAPDLQRRSVFVVCALLCQHGRMQDIVYVNMQHACLHAPCAVLLSLL